MLSMCCVVLVLVSSLKCLYDQLQIRKLQNAFWFEARSKKLPIIVFQDPKHLIATPPFPEIQEVLIGSRSTTTLALHSSVVILSLHTLQFHPEDLDEIITNAFRVSKDSNCLLIWKWCDKKHQMAPKRKILSTPPERKSITWESIGHVH